MKSTFTKLISIFILIGTFASPLFTLADSTTTVIIVPANQQTTNTPANPYNYNLTPNYITSLINSSIGTASGTSKTASTSGSGLTSSAVSAIGCGAGQVLSNLVTSTVSSAVGGASSAVSSMTNVPVSEQGDVGTAIKTQASAHTGTSMGLGGVSTLAAPSWDSIAYCIVNAMIIYIADSTIRWINTGFNGNPSFLNNPGQFFEQLANEEAASFVQNLAYGTLGVNVCDVYRAAMVQSIINQYNNQAIRNGGYGANKGINNGFLGCTFNQNPNQLNSFMKGNFIQGGGWNSWYQVTQTQNNNPYTTYFNTNDRFNNQILSTQQKTATELNQNHGFLSFKQCPADQKGKLNQTNCTTVTPGTVIQDQLNSTLNLGKNRLVLASKFDEVVSALVNQLITTALGQALKKK